MEGRRCWDPRGARAAITHECFREAHLRGFREDVQMDQAESGHAQQQEGGIQRGEEDPGEACWDSPHGLWGGGTPVGTPSSSHDR